MANGDLGGGLGTVSSPYLIADVQDLIAAKAKSPSEAYLLTGDIDCAGHAIGQWKTNFTGLLDGAGYSVKNWENRGVGGQNGFIGFLSGTLKNFHLENAKLLNSTGYNAGLLADSYNGAGLVNGCSVSGEVHNGGSSSTGGMFGTMSGGGKVTNCFANCTIVGGPATGGLVGAYSAGVVENCYASGSVTGGNNVGGLIGVDGNSISTYFVKNCFSSASVSGINNVGGFVGKSTNFLHESCYALAPYVRRISGVLEKFGAYCGSGSPAPEKKCYSLTETEFRV